LASLDLALWTWLVRKWEVGKWEVGKRKEAKE
jgi:hypothetical protein